MFTEKFIEYELIECKYFAGRNYTALQTIKFIESSKIEEIQAIRIDKKYDALWVRVYYVQKRIFKFFWKTVYKSIYSSDINKFLNNYFH